MKSVVLLCLLFSTGLLPVHSQVKVSESTFALPASDEGAPDENAAFDAFSEIENYPYTLRQNIRSTESVRQWRALILENEYLKCTILPELGGHIYTCVDKINGKPMFYANPSFKKANIAYRGVWTAYGDEFNFPISHNWVTVSPIDWAYSSAADGSASVTVGNRDRVYGMDWTVEIVLRPGSTVLEQHVTLTNRGDVRHRFYWWNNAGVEIWPDTRIYYPMRFAAPDGVSEIESWPVNSKGKDLSVIANQTEGQISIFAYGSNEPFMGVYSPHTESGLVHWADPKTVPSKKLFSWGLPDGLTWSESLSDNHSRYVEVQAGLFQDQNTYGFLAPRQSIRFEEFWMPVRNIGSISRATLDGVVSLRRETKADGKVVLKVAFNANHAIPGASIVVSHDEHAVYQKRVSLKPATTWEHVIAGVVPEKKYTFLLKNAKGETLLTHTEGAYDVIANSQVHVGPQPEKKLPDPKAWTEADYLASANDQELQGNSISAWETYQNGLAKYPASLLLLKAAGRLAIGRWHFEDAAKWLGQAASAAPADAEVHYYRGIAETALDHSVQARSEFESARLSAKFRPAAGLLLAEIMAREHDTVGALHMLEESCPVSDRDQRCIEETVALERADKEFDHAKALIADSLPRNPTSLFLRNEAAKMGVAVKPGSFAPDVKKHLAADTNRILNLVREYNRLGLYADSIELLSRTYPSVAPEESEPSAPLPSNDPLLAYYRGFSREKLGQPGAADYAAAAAMSLLYIFPNDVDDFAVLRAALAVNGSDASAHFLLGSLFFSKNLVDPGMDEWKRAEALNPRIPSLQDNVGRALLQIKKQPAEAAAEFQSGIQVEPGNPGLYMGLNEAMRQMGRSAGQRADMLLRFPDPANMPPDLVRAVVKALNESGRNKEADAFLKKRFVPAKEGQAPLQPSN